MDTRTLATGRLLTFARKMTPRPRGSQRVPITIHGSGEEERGLHDHADATPQISRVQFAIVPAIETHSAAGRLVEAIEEPQERRLARSAWTDHGHHLAGAHLHAELFIYRASSSLLTLGARLSLPPVRL
jgi:hypothetical protein